ncbi:guanylate kinase [Abyssisolibacter fermentans]|uniref:guanylate kinase n=1 Tax=Abyssisolibacter fermentans TaxID=1766203 RepID=UPI000835CF23|nr:guanylate kinase [Abyssisolibacter fermentans]
MKKGLLIVVSGPSGVGKGTICNTLINKNKDIYMSVSATTRKPRNGEIHGKSYYFLSEEDFKQKIKNDEFIEYAKVFNNYYGTLKSVIMEKIEAGKNVLLEIDVQGALQVKEKYKEAVMIFILPPSLEVLKERIIGRGSENDKTLNIRLNEAQNEIDMLHNYNYSVKNADLKTACKQVEAIIIAETCKIKIKKQ